MQNTAQKHDISQGETTYFDKPRIIQHTKTMLAKLRRRKILVDDIVAQLNAHGITMTRARFEDLFTSRPHRVTIATPQTFMTLVTVCFAYIPQILSAGELIDFADAARLPLSFYDQLAVHYPAAVWQDAWYEILPSAKAQLNRHAMVHRGSELNRLLAAVSAEQSVIISGPAGIGKTALALALVAELELLTTQRIPVVTIRQPLQTVSELSRAIAHASNIKPLHNEPIELRMESVLPRQRATYIGLDSFHTSPNDVSIVSAFLRQFPIVRLIMTTTLDHEPNDGLFGERLRTAHIEHLRPLPDTSANSPAMVLFLQTLNTLGTQYANTDATRLLTLCRHAHGNPRAIQRAAQLHSVTGNGVADSVPYEHLSLVQLTLLSFCVAFDEALSHGFLLSFFAGQYPREQLDAALESLVALHVLERLYSDQQHRFVVQPEARQWYQQRLSPAQIAAEYEQHLNRLIRYAMPRTVTMLQAVTRHDALSILSLLRHAHQRAPQCIFEVARCLGSWQEIWMYHDVSAQVIILAEEIIRVHRVIHPVMAELCVTTARVYHSRGQADHAHRLLTHALEYVSETQYPVIWAKALCVRAANMMDAPQHRKFQPPPSIDRSADLARALTIFAHEPAPEHLCYAYQLQAQLAIAQRDLPAALRACDAALAVCVPQPLTIDYVAIRLLHSVVQIYDGSLDLAQAQLSTLHDELSSYSLSNYHATIHLRMAAIAALQHDLTQASIHIVDSFELLKHIGSLNDILLAADIICLIHIRSGERTTALHIHALCDTARAHYGIQRIHYIEQLVERVLADIPVSERERVTPPATATIYDVIAVLQTVQQGMMSSVS